MNLTKKDIARIAERKAKRSADKRTKETYGKEGRRFYEKNISNK
jgi:hypothetical protein